MIGTGQTDILLEIECKSKDYNTFVDNILSRENMVWTLLYDI